MKVTDTADKFSVPIGTYHARLLGNKEMPPSTKYPDSKPSFAWEFEIIEGEHAGKVSSRFTPQNVSTGNSLGKFMRELLARNIVNNEEIDTARLIGKNYLITVGPSADGLKTRCIMVAPVKLPGLAPPPTMPPAGLRPVFGALDAPTPPKPLPVAAPTPTPGRPEAKIPEKLFVSLDGVSAGALIDYQECYQKAGSSLWASAMIFDQEKAIYVKASDYFMPF